MNISVEDLFPESFQRIKEEEEANRPDPNWFAHLPPEKINAYMSKYPFKSFDDIPLDNSGLQYPSLQELEFYFPPAALAAKEGANKQVISSQADSLIKISRIWADFFPANTSNQPI